MTNPAMLDDPAFKCLRVRDLEGYRRAAAGRERLDFSGADLRGTDLRGVEMSNVILRDAYLRDADLRGCDLRQSDLEGASLHNAKVAGAYFPANIAAEELLLSLQYGTRLRARNAAETKRP
jgi:uncharacterized protein YjbI with pentapeptide repeats